jgi:hypothetical protein
MLLFAGLWIGGATEVWGQLESMSRSERKAEERRMKEMAKAEKKAFKEWEKNYKKLQEEHYKRQRTGREKNLVLGDSAGTVFGGVRTRNHSRDFKKDNVKKRMRKGQQKARRHRDGRAVSWWRRLWVRRSWKKH